jgi:imidazoleglycerol phosphate synthase glutamine amidotransferase subunit HisH
MPILMQRHRIFHDRGKEYYLLLHSYAVKNKLKLSADEQYRLKKRAGLPATKLAFGKQIDPEYHSGLGCRHRKDLY